jgi:hypothetical protein
MANAALATGATMVLARPRLPRFPTPFERRVYEGELRRWEEGGEHDPELLRRARKGEITRANTVPGSPERSAVDRITYERRRAHHPELTARQSLGHERAGDVPPTVSFFAQLGAGAALLEDVTVSRRDARRVGRYLSLVGLLTEGRLAPAAFAARVKNWRPVTILGPPGFRGQVRFLADPAAVLALAEVERGEERESWIDSGRRRPSARSRR